MTPLQMPLDPYPAPAPPHHAEDAPGQVQPEPYPASTWPLTRIYLTPAPTHHAEDAPGQASEEVRDGAMRCALCRHGDEVPHAQPQALHQLQGAAEDVQRPHNLVQLRHGGTAGARRECGMRGLENRGEGDSSFDVAALRGQEGVGERRLENTGDSSSDIATLQGQEGRGG